MNSKRPQIDLCGGGENGKRNEMEWRQRRMRGTEQSNYSAEETGSSKIRPKVKLWIYVVSWTKEKLYRFILSLFWTTVSDSDSVGEKKSTVNLTSNGDPLFWAGGIETIRKLCPNWHFEVIIHQNKSQRSHDPRRRRREIVAQREGWINMAIMCCGRPFRVPTPSTSSWHLTVHTGYKTSFGYCEK